MTWGLMIVLVLLVLFIFALLTLGEGLLKVAASQNGVEAGDYSVLPNSFSSLFGRAKNKPKYLPEGVEVKHLKRGFDINLAGAADSKAGAHSLRVSNYSIKPTDIIGMSPIPKVLFEVGAQIKAGSPLFFDKKRPEIIYAAPISGELIEVRRGENRLISELIILADQGEVQYHKYAELPNPSTATREEIVNFLLGSGAWPFIRQRPFDLVADPTDTPKAIFVTTFDSAPLAPNLNLAVEGKEAAFRKGLEVLAKLSGSKVHLGLSARTEPAAAYINAGTVEGVETHWFDGPHPAGNVGIQIHHIDPVLPGSTVWYTDVHGVILIGTLFNEGIFDSERVVVLSGAEFSNPRYVKVHQGANLEQVLSDLPADFKEELVWTKDAESVKKVQKPTQVRTIRIISGDVLTGSQVERNSNLKFYDDQITAVREGNYYEILGWLVPQTGHPTLSRTFVGGFYNDLEYTADTNSNGEKRAFVMTGEYESVLPMDIHPQHVFRAIMCNDIEKLEGLGLLELSEEDVALCEFVCTSKQPLQKMLREGLDLLRNS
jgi:Na+-transporting NADH:ubiquinone oxidoreductase subunit A